ncbi:uncharacterized protein LOC136040915 isoform X2 [Artemia franciscana]|uniref:uncharacterized protein LOC136040915 isoform X2 n=1 Tax=Artemia franciscana TaxID=6661 RepID=UPI0032DA442B
MHKMKSVAVFVYILGASLALEPEYRNSGEEIVPEVVGDNPVEQEDQQGDYQTNFRRLLLQEQIRPALSQFFRGLPQRQNFITPQVSRYSQGFFRTQPAYLLSPTAFEQEQYYPSFQRG